MSATINQPYIFMSIIYGGLIIGFIFGIFSAVSASSGKKAVQIVCDILFFVICIPISLVIFYISNKTDMRLFSFLGIFIGVLLYHFGLGYFVRKKKKIH